MKKLAVFFCLSALATAAFAQGTVNFVNSSGPLVGWNPGGTNVAPYPHIPGPAGGFYFALLTAPLGTTDPTAFTFSGVYGTNLAVAGVLRGGSSVNGWVPGTSRSFEIAGWSADGGYAWNPSWINNGATRNMSYWGVSVIGSGFAGGIDPVTGGPIPALNLFGGNGIPTTSAFTLQPVPEPATLALAGLGAAALLIFRRRK